MSDGKVYLVGAGPGEVELITLKGLRLVQKADVILYDHLLSMELLSFALPGAEIISVGKFAGKHTYPQDEINALLVEKAKEGKTVVRLKGGDCYLFGRGGEEAEYCFEKGVEFEVVPGVTSALSAPCYAGIPPTHRDCTNNVAVVSGHRKKGDDRPIEIPKAGTVIFLMSVANLANIISSLIKAGWAKDTKIAAVEHGTWYDQRVLTGTLDDFLEITQKAKIRTPAIFIVGDVVDYKDKLGWFAKKPRILVLGNHPQRYRHLGTIVHRRIIDCVAVDDYSKADEAITHLDETDWVIFTSANGIRYFMARVFDAGLDSRVFANVKIGVIGKATGERLREFGLMADLCAAHESSEGLLREFEQVGMKEAKILLPQALVSSSVLPDGLAEMGAKVESIAVYKTVDMEPGEVDFDYIDKVLFTSGSTVRAFVKYFGKMPKNVKAICLGEPTQNVAKENDIDAEILQKDD